MISLKSEAKIVDINDAMLHVPNPQGLFALGDVELFVLASVDVEGNGNLSDRRPFSITIELDKNGNDPIPSVLFQEIPSTDSLMMDVHDLVDDETTFVNDIEGFIAPIRAHFKVMVDAAIVEQQERRQSFEELRSLEEELEHFSK